MIDINKAKSRLLSLAFRGLLFDYPVKKKQNDALAEIHKCTKKFASVTENEQLAEAPSYWNWSRLGYLTKNHGQTVPEEDFCYIDVGTLDNIHNRLAEKEKHICAENAPSRARKIVHEGDVIYSTVRPYLHNICLIDREFSKTPIASTAFCVMAANESVLLNKYLFYWLLTPEFDKYSNGDPSKGALYPAISEKDLLRGTIPIPPIEEQKYIVEKIEQAFTILDTIDELQAKYADNLTALKSKLIDAAIQGKLTEQLPEDGTAEELYQQIQTEKIRLSKIGKTYREKGIKVITDNDIPYDIPDTWRWVRLGDLTTVITKGSSPSWQGISYTSKEEGILFVTSENVGNGKMILSKKKYVESKFNDMHPSSILIKGDILTNLVGASIGRTAVYDEDIDNANINQAVCIIRLVEREITDYLLLYLGSITAINEMLHGSVDFARANLSLTSVSNLMIPLPPLAEQKRIVQKLDEILPLCESLK